MAIDRFDGAILGVGTTSGVRVVVGRWEGSPLGAFADVMLATADDQRVLLAPDEAVAEYVSQTYNFDEVVHCPVTVRDTGDGASRRWHVSAGELVLDVVLGGRTATGRLLRPIPTALATSRPVAVLADPFARLLHPGVRTVGTAGGGRREYYGARDQHAVEAVAGSWRGVDLGRLAPVDPPPRFGFSSTPRTPSLTRVRTTIVRSEVVGS
ncbi:hypothetical protein [Janibacter sp. UYMM211]